MIAWPAVVFATLLGYLVGSIPCGYLVGRAFGIDPRSQGSGKMGATNVHRILGRKASVSVLLCDMAKGAAAVAIAKLAFGGVVSAEVAAGLAAIIGHVFPIFAGFKGGRGVATSLGAMFVISPIVALVGFVGGLVVIAVSRLASLGSLIGSLVALLLVAALFVSQLQPLVPLIYCFLAALLLAITHRDNIQRLVTGTERKIQL